MLLLKTLLLLLFCSSALALKCHSGDAEVGQPAPVKEETCTTQYCYVGKDDSNIYSYGCQPESEVGLCTNNNGGSFSIPGGSGRCCSTDMCNDENLINAPAPPQYPAPSVDSPQAPSPDRTTLPPRRLTCRDGSTSSIMENEGTNDVKEKPCSLGHCIVTLSTSSGQSFYTFGCEKELCDKANGIGSLENTDEASGVTSTFACCTTDLCNVESLVNPPMPPPLMRTAASFFPVFTLAFGTFF